MDERKVIHHDYRQTGLDDEALAWIKHASVYHSKPDAEPCFLAVAAGCEGFLGTILRNCPPSPDRTRALNMVRDSRMVANSAIALEG